MKVLGLVASPRKNGNSEILVKEMLSALPADTEKEMIRLSSLDIKQCNACYACLPSEAGCIVKDDLAFLLDKIKTADAVIIAAACYFLGPHTSIKTINDRLISVLANAADYTGKKCVTAVTYGVPGWEGYAREAVNNFARFLHLEVQGDMLVNAASPGEAVRPEVLAAARELAGRLVDDGQADIEAPGVISCQGCGSSLLQLAPDGKVRCVMCGTEGMLKSAAGGFGIDFAAGGHLRFSPAGMDHHSRLLEDIKRQFIATRQELAQLRRPYSNMDWWVEPNR
ncbi:MAG: NAD(P)H-dependent oxidoreductase [Negativicutes bacterium]|nr:NAD(P)H-dependent oxidoreductase [Negativicutes bacterium]MDR3590720.1 NAD(P)H-dependent oxidoreductase [Negativicutes bacterium]